MRHFPQFDPSRTTFPMFRLMHQIATPNAAALAASTGTIEVEDGKGMNALQSMFERMTNGD